MQCTRPLECVKDYNDINPKTGNAAMVFNPSKVFAIKQILDEQFKGDQEKLKKLTGYEYLQVPCGKCPSCRSNWCRDWSIRAFHESLLYPTNVFLTLTYNQKHLPDIYEDVQQAGEFNRHPQTDFQKFMKRFRQKLWRDLGERVRFFHVFEYGSSFQRPHHHAIIYGTSLPDKYYWKTKNGFPIYRSPMLEDAWSLIYPDGHKEKMGFTTVQDVSYEVCAYVARYCMKKVDVDCSWYDGRIPEFNLRSRMPGLGHDWLLKNKDDVYNDDELVIKNYITRPPRYYDNLFDVINSPRMEVIKRERKDYAVSHPSEDSAERLRQIENYQFHKIQNMKRYYENEVNIDVPEEFNR